MKNGESKNTAFKRLATNRTNNVIRNIRLLGNLSNRHNYSFTQSDFKHIFASIENEMKLTKARFAVALNKNNKFRI